MTAVRRLKISPTMQKNLPEVVNRFLGYKQAQGLAPRSLMDYQHTFNKFMQYTTSDELAVAPLQDALLLFFQRFKDQSPTSYNIPYKNLNCFFAWCIEQEYLSQNPLKRIGLKIKKDTPKVKHHDADTISKLIKAPGLGTLTGLRDYSLMLLTLDCGIRPSEAFGLRIPDIDFVHKRVTISAAISKTRVARELPLSAPVLQTLEKLISVRLTQFEDYVFMGLDGNPLNRNSWNRRLALYCEKAGIEKVRPYDLRHCFAIMFIRNGGDPFALQILMGHADLQMTKLYVKLANSDVVKQHTQSSPVKQFVKRSTRVTKLFR
ncbi:MAG: integrase [Firmicutes bacterium HGW-Firmicutes-15]|nr:MAG: integrase [Firmicutes bacterium HGW-Firmicutes-15]